MSGSRQRLRRGLVLTGVSLALLMCGCARTDAETATSAAADPAPPLEGAELFGATEAAADASAPGQIPAPPLLFDPAHVPSHEPPPPTTSPLADL